jgi:hypothetical protein
MRHVPEPRLRQTGGELATTLSSRPCTPPAGYGGREARLRVIAAGWLVRAAGSLCSCRGRREGGCRLVTAAGW